MIVRELLALIGLDVDKGSFASADTALGKAKSGLEALGRAAFSVGADLAKSTLAFIDTTGQINDAAASAQVATDAFQELAYAAGLSDVNSEKLGVGLKSLNSLLTEAQKYGSEASKEFVRLGIRTRDASGHVRSAEGNGGQRRIDGYRRRQALLTPACEHCAAHAPAANQQDGRDRPGVRTGA